MVKYRCQLAGTDFIFRLSSQNYNEDIIALSRDLSNKELLVISWLFQNYKFADMIKMLPFTDHTPETSDNATLISKHQHTIIGFVPF